MNHRSFVTINEHLGRRSHSSWAGLSAIAVGFVFLTIPLLAEPATKWLQEIGGFTFNAGARTVIRQRMLANGKLMIAGSLANGAWAEAIDADGNWSSGGSYPVQLGGEVTAIGPFGEIFVAAGRPAPYTPSSGPAFTAAKIGIHGQIIWSGASVYEIPGGLDIDAIEIDRRGDVIIAGTIDLTDVFVTKLDGLTGTALWSRVWESGASYDVVQRVAIDPWGDVVVTAISYGNISAFKLSGADGSVSWTHLYDPGATFADSISAVVVDTSGYILISATAGTDVVALKLASAGSRIWASVMAKPATYERVVAAVIDGSDDFIVVSESGSGWLVVKFHGGTGDVLWETTRPMAASGVPLDLVTDGQGDVFIVGAQSDHGAILKLDGVTGVEEWLVEQPDMQTVFVDLDSAGRPYITGAGVAWDYKLTTRALNANGSTRWTHFAFNQVPTDIQIRTSVVDAAGNVFVAANPGYGMTIYKYDANGSPVWTSGLTGPATGFESMAVDPAGDLLVTARGYSVWNNDAVYLHKLSGATGATVWVSSWSRAGGGFDDNARALVVDGAGNSYVVGSSIDDNDWYSQDLLLVSFAPDGSTRWAAPFDSSVADRGDGVTIAADGGIVVVGQSNSRPVIRKHQSSDGQLLWSTMIDTLSGSDGFAEEVRQFGAGHLVVTGAEYGNPSENHFIARVDPTDGQVDWALSTTEIDRAPAHPPMFDTAGNPIILSGSIYRTTSKLMKFDALDGDLLWTLEHAPEIEAYDTMAATTSDGSAVIVVGASRFAAAPRDSTAHISKVSTADGSLVWGPFQYDSGTDFDSAELILPAGSDFVVAGKRGFDSYVTRLTEDFGIDLLDGPVPPGFCGKFYELQLIARNGTPPYTWTVISGALPPGLSLNSSTGMIDGVPSEEGTFIVRVRAADGLLSYDRDLYLIVDTGTPYELIDANTNPVCAGTPVELSLSSAFASYLWEPGGATTPALVTSPQHPTLFGVSLGGTLSCLVRGALDVRVTPPLTGVSIRVDGTPATCPSGAVTTLVALNDGGGRSSYQWGYRTTPGGATTMITGAISPRYVLDRDDFPGTGTFYVVYDTTPFCGPSMTSAEVAISVLDFGSPSGLAVEATSDGAITLTWMGASGPSVDHYNIYRANGLCPGTGATKIGETVGAVTSWVDTTGTPGATYSYTVRAASTDNVCESLPTVCKSAVPYGTCTLAPSFNGLVFVTTSSCELSLSWSLATSRCPSANGVTYNVYRSTVPSFVPDASNRIVSCVANNRWLDKTVQGGTTHYYIVRAEDGTSGGNGPCNHGNEDGNLVRVSGNPAAAVETETLLLSDNFESGQRPPGADALWFEQAVSGGDQLSIVTCKSAGSGVASYRWGQVGGCTGTYADSSESRLTLGGDPSAPGTGIAIPAGETARLRFRHDVRTEAGDDGATLYYKTDLMGSFAIVGASFAAGAPYIVRGPYNSNLGYPTYRSVWSGSTWKLVPFYEVWVNLDGVAGRTIWFQWLFTSDPGSHYEGYYLDDVVIETTVPAACDAGPPPVTAVSTLVRGTTTRVEWVNPLSAQYGATLVRYSNSGTCCPPMTPTSEVFAALKAGTAGGKDSHTLTTRTDGYPMGLFVDDGTSRYSRPKIVIAGNGFPSAAKWVFQTNASAMTPPGIIGGAGGKTFVVSNDRVFHSLNNGLTGGEWPSAWTPPVFDAPSQSRTLVLELPIGGSPRKVVLVGTQNGYVYCVDALTGAIIWTSPLLGDVVQGSPSAISTVYGAPFSLVLAGARTTDGTGRVYGLDPENGAIRWTFENLMGQGGDGLVVGAINDAINFAYADAGGGKRRAWFGSRRKSGGSQDTLWALAFDASSVTKLWSRDVGPIDGFPIQGGATLYAGTNASKVWAVDAVTGVPVWASPFDASDGPVKVTVWPDTANARIYFSTTNHVWSIGTDGLVRWKKLMTAPSTPNRTTGALLVGSGDGRIYQLGNLLVTDQAQLTVKSVFLAGGYVGGATLDKTNGLAYVGTTEGKIFAVPFPIP